ncbi:hypothetical protein KKC17_03130 [Patescibacteria group bacterium]|nr:hypothetical protein [Patescibacteria group bacterium]
MFNYPRNFFYLFLFICLLLGGASCGLKVTSKVSGGVYVSDNQGTSWQVKSYIGKQKNKDITLQNNSIKQIIFNQSDTKIIYAISEGKLAGLFKTSDQGVNWQVVVTGQLNGLALQPKNDQVIYAISDSKVARSKDGGEAWVEVYLETTKDVKLNQIAVDSFNPEVVYVGNDKGVILLSQDQGTSWQQVHYLTGGLAHLIVKNNIIYASQPSGKLWRSYDRGKNWEDLTTNLRREIKGNLGSARALVFLPESDKALLYATNYGLSRSLDGGQNWDNLKLVTSSGSIAITALAVGPLNGRQIYYTSDQAFYRSSDAGVTWETLALPISARPLNLAVSPQNNNLIFMGFNR